MDLYHINGRFERKFVVYNGLKDAGTLFNSNRKFLKYSLPDLSCLSMKLSAVESRKGLNKGVRSKVPKAPTCSSDKYIAHHSHTGYYVFHILSFKCYLLHLSYAFVSISSNINFVKMYFHADAAAASKSRDNGTKRSKGPRGSEHTNFISTSCGMKTMSQINLSGEHFKLSTIKLAPSVTSPGEFQRDIKRKLKRSVRYGNPRPFGYLTTTMSMPALHSAGHGDFNKLGDDVLVCGKPPLNYHSAPKVKGG